MPVYGFCFYQSCADHQNKPESRTLPLSNPLKVSIWSPALCIFSSRGEGFVTPVICETSLFFLLQLYVLVFDNLVRCKLDATLGILHTVFSLSVVLIELLFYVPNTGEALQCLRMWGLEFLHFWYFSLSSFFLSMLSDSFF